MIEIRELRTIDEFHAVEDMQKEVWSCNDREIVPAMHMIPAREVGAIILGAFDSGAMVGFVYGFPGFEGAARVIHSDMLAVRSGWRDSGVGRDLKMAQRARAIEAGIDRITWTFDPLQARNAFLNFARLGAISNRYVRDFYGISSSPLHRLGTDRLWVTWPLKDSAPLRPSSTHHIQIPSDIDSLMKHDETQAVRWREKTRVAFEEAFAKGFVVTGFERGSDSSSYVLTR